MGKRLTYDEIERINRHELVEREIIRKMIKDVIRNKWRESFR